ncbi:lytic transglycosylase domain-containing protein [Glaciihabitans sp. INWT7]|uniref:lytic transglycosylase domain-containing protein n=1 Tax=Glaciihabitans sp. INWT7 TaxID=2596912 RepID=UPI002107884A|nr:lytic transglycosylase domain-containing protein [Glaciihabitans sp. INWT7]
MVLQCIALLALVGWGAAVWSSSVHQRPATERYAREDVAPEPTASPEPPVATPAVPPALPISARIDPTWLDTVSLRTGIPRTALAAYAGAASVLAEQSPGCHLGWNTLAAIGHLESDDGRDGGAVLSDDGYPSVPILGPALDGGAFAGIHDSDGGAWDGDTVWDHAVGPFQFIPETWRRWGADGNGDGKQDPNQIADAALAAAHYLCHAGDLSTVDGWRRAVLSYNHSERYVDDVARAANSL